MLLAHRAVVASLVRDVSAMAHAGTAARIREDTDRLHRLLVGAAAGEHERARVTAAVGALVYPVSTLDDGDLAGLRDPLVAAALGALGAD